MGAQAMQTKPYLLNSDVSKVLDAARGEAQRNKWAVTIAIVDDGGHLLSLERMDGCAPSGSLIAPAKARTAALGRRESRLFEEMINQGRTAFLSAPNLDGLLEGGIPLMWDGQVVGAVGVSGVKPEQDSEVARVGALALK